MINPREGDLRLISRFIEAVERSFLPLDDDHWFAPTLGNAELCTAISELDGADEDSRLDAIDQLLSNPNREVRLWSAVVGLRHNVTTSVAVLKELALHNDLAAFIASLWLDRWKRDEYEAALDAILVHGISQDGSITQLAEDSKALPMPSTRTAQLSRIKDLERIDDRISAANVICPFTIGVNESSLSWVPDHEPPSSDETMVWLWVISPEFGKKIARATSNTQLKKMLVDYYSKMDGRGE